MYLELLDWQEKRIFRGISLALHFGQWKSRPIELSDFTITKLMKYINPSEAADDIRPLLTHHFSVRCFQAAEKPIKRIYTGVAT